MSGMMTGVSRVRHCCCSRQLWRTVHCVHIWKLAFLAASHVGASASQFGIVKAMKRPTCHQTTLGPCQAFPLTGFASQYD